MLYCKQDIEVINVSESALGPSQRLQALLCAQKMRPVNARAGDSEMCISINISSIIN
jgi:hypothetical protein